MSTHIALYCLFLLFLAGCQIETAKVEPTPSSNSSAIAINSFLPNEKTNSATLPQQINTSKTNNIDFPSPDPTPDINASADHVARLLQQQIDAKRANTSNS